MQRIRIQKSRRRAQLQRPTAEPLPLDPRDPDIVRARDAQRQAPSAAATRSINRKENTDAAP